MQDILLNFPEFEFRTKVKAGKTYIWDETRKTWLFLTPEERVRQHLYRYLTNTKGWPKGLTETEVKVNINGNPRRFDLMIRDKDLNPALLAECKAPSVKITQETFMQIAAYAFVLRPKYLIVTNGLDHFCCKLNQSGAPEFLKEIPEYEK